LGGPWGGGHASGSRIYAPPVQALGSVRLFTVTSVSQGTRVHRLPTSAGWVSLDRPCGRSVGDLSALAIFRGRGGGRGPRLCSHSDRCAMGLCLSRRPTRAVGGAARQAVSDDFSLVGVTASRCSCCRLRVPQVRLHPARSHGAGGSHRTAMPHLSPQTPRAPRGLAPVICPRGPAVLAVRSFPSLQGHPISEGQCERAARSSMLAGSGNDGGVAWALRAAGAALCRFGRVGVRARRASFGVIFCYFSSGAIRSRASCHLLVAIARR